LDVEYHFDVPVSFSVIKGITQLERWDSGFNVEKYRYIDMKENKLIFKIGESEEYYFILENSKEKKAIGTIHFKTDATCFDTEKANGFLWGSFRADFEFSSSYYLVITNPSYEALKVTIQLSTSRARILLVFTFLFYFLINSCFLWRKRSSNLEKIVL